MAKLHAKVDQLREWRKRKIRDTSIESSLIEFRKSLKKSNKQLTQIMEAWDNEVPQQLSQNAIPTSLRAGVLEVSVRDSSTSYQLNQLIRAGLLCKLQEQCSGTLKQIRVRISR
jgi:hypothetical protein